MTHQADGINGALHGAATLRALARRLLDAILPPHCLKCRVPVGEPGSLCADCWNAVTFIAEPVCAACGLPFEVPAGRDALCGGCLRRRPVFERARAALAYDDASRDMILAFKHADRTEAAPAFARWMARAGRDLTARADMVAPVPLHWRRFWRRRYNQSALLARALGGQAGIAVVPDLLVRARSTPSQGGLGRAARARNVRGAFRLNGRMAARVRGARVLLVDDVYTTGATVEACARVLLRAGAAAVDVLTLARVVRPGG